MKKILSTFFMLYALFCLNATNNNDVICESGVSFQHDDYPNIYMICESELLVESCFSFLHGIWNEYFGGINLSNVGDFLDSVAYCEAVT